MDVKRLNEQRKRNQGRLPVDFCFRITKEERDCLRSQIATFTERTRDRKYLPYVFAEDNWPREPCCAYGHINIVSSKITIRGVQVMLDSDIACLFQVGVKLMNQQMKRNPDRFPEDFCFQLTKEGILRSQFATSSSWGGRRYLPYVYTEQGIIALAGVFFILQ